MDTPPGKADQGSRKGLLETGLLWGRTAICGGAGPQGHSLIERGQQGLDLAEFRRPFVPERIDGPQQQPQPDFLGQGDEGSGLEAANARLRRIAAIAQSEKALGAVGQDLDRGIGASEPACEPHQRASIAALGCELRQQRAQTGPRIFAADLAEGGAGGFLFLQRGERLAKPRVRRSENCRRLA